MCIRDRDKTGEIIGLSYQEIQQINSMLANIATNLLRPVIYIPVSYTHLDKPVCINGLDIRFFIK